MLADLGRAALRYGTSGSLLALRLAAAIAVWAVLLPLSLRIMWRLLVELDPDPLGGYQAHFFKFVCEGGDGEGGRAICDRERGLIWY